MLGEYGLEPRIASVGGGWSDLVGHGLFAFHGGALRTVDHEAPSQPLIEVFAEAGNLDALTRNGIEADLVDEAFGRSLRVVQPDGAQLWINETQHDLYGYHHIGA